MEPLFTSKTSSVHGYGTVLVQLTGLYALKETCFPLSAKGECDSCEKRGRVYFEEQAQAQMIAALKQVKTGRALEDGRGRWGVEIHSLRAESKVWRDGCEPGARSEAVAQREHATAEVGSRSESGQRSAAVGDSKSRVELVAETVHFTIGTYIRR